MINRQNDYLVILVATYNRIKLLKKTINSIKKETKTPHEIIVIDGGSNDGTIEYLKTRRDITAVFQGKLIGTSRAYNRVWRDVRCRYTCWLSDDTEVVGRSLDLAVNILEFDKSIGMVGLKMKDTLGPGKKVAYMGGISEYGILNCNHGVLRYDLLKAVGFFNESYRSYTIDPDLTASILCSGKKVVMTKNISLMHHREWATKEDMLVRILREMGGVDNQKIYRGKFRFLKEKRSYFAYIKLRLAYLILRLFYSETNAQISRLGLNRQDVTNIVSTRFIKIFDPIENLFKTYHLVQKIPIEFLRSKRNPFRNLAAKV